MSTDILLRVFRVLTEPVPYTFVSVNRRNDKGWVHTAINVGPRFIIQSQNIRGYTDNIYSVRRLCCSAVAAGNAVVLVAMSAGC